MAFNGKTMDPFIFLEKIRRPDKRGLVRDRLETRVAALQPDTEGPVSLALVLGPPGSGKTTLLSHLAATAGPCAWYRVGPEDNDEVSLTRHLGHTLGAALADHSLITAAAGGRIADLIKALDDPPRAAQLIIDDLHQIDGTPAERALGTFVTMRSPGVKVILGSRRPPMINTSRLLVSGELIELNSDDLRFRSWEVEQLFRSVYEAPLSPEGAAALTRRTGGWAAGLHLFHLATAQMGRAERERAIDELSGRSRLVRSYLARNVLGSLDVDRRRFLMLTSTLGVLTGDLCDDLLGTSGSAAVLSALEEEQFFTTSTDGGITYRYHQVMQTQLQALLFYEQGGRAARELFVRSGQLLEDAGRIGAAVHAFARAEDWGSVARLLQPAAMTVVGGDGLLGMLSVPGVPTDDPGLVLAGARLLVRRGQLADAVAAYRRAEALVDDPQLGRLSEQERQSVALWLDTPPGPASPARIGLSSVSVQLRELTRNAWTEVSEPLARVLRLIMVGDLEKAASDLAASELGDGWPALATRLAERFIDLLRGADDVNAAQVEPIVLEAEVDGWPWLARIARGVETAMLLAAAPSEWRVASAVELLDTLERQRDTWTECLTSLAVGVGFAQAGREDLATQTLARASNLADDLGAPALRQWADRLADEASRTQPPGGHPQLNAPAVTVSAVTVSAVTGSAVTGSRPARRRVALVCLGGFSLSVDGRELGWRELRPKARSLLMLLALHHGRVVHREELVDTLWPDLTLTSGIRSLQVAVSSIRQCLWTAGLSKEALRRHGEAYVLELSDAEDQLRSFERFASEAARGSGSPALHLRSAALDLYAGDLLPEAGPAEWVVGERDRLRRLAGSVASAAAVDALQAGDPRTALECARRSTALDPYHDSSWELVIESCIRLGDQAAVAAARREQARAWADLGLAH